MPPPPLSSPHHRLRMLAHTRRLVGVMLPLGAGTGLVVAFALRGLGSFEPWVGHVGGRTHLTLLLPALGLFLVTLWLSLTRIGEVSLFKDLSLAHRDPHEVFPFWRSLGKVWACAMTIGFGGSAGVEGPGKWLGSALGLQFHRSLRALSQAVPILRRLMAPASVMVRAGSAAALAAVFRAPLSGALMAAEQEGVLDSDALVPCLFSAATGFMVFSAWMGLQPLIPVARTYQAHFTGILWAVLLGLACGLLASAFLWLKALLRRRLDPIPLMWRGLVAGLGLALLALPAHFLWEGFPVTQGGGLELVAHLLKGDTLSRQAILFLALKLVATALTLAGGGIGGIWLPSIAMGASLGAAFDGVLGLGQPGYMTLIGGAAFAGATHETLLIPVVFLAETTAQAGLVIPALVGTGAAYLVVRERP
ncbi:MAG: chloride channel protein [Acidobacteria bacterium]|nr:chloride channel protein [Acidobacteriota bacterium]